MNKVIDLFEQLASDLQNVNASISAHKQIQGTIAQYKQQAQELIKQEQKDEE